MKHFFLKLLLITFTMIASLAAFSQSKSAKVDIKKTQTAFSEDDFINTVFELDPNLQAIENKISMLKAEEQSITTWSDPVLSFDYSNMPIIRPWPGNHAMSGIQVGIGQKIPWPTKQSSKIAYQKARRQTMGHIYSQKKKKITLMIRTLFNQLFAYKKYVQQQNALIELLTLAKKNATTLNINKQNQQLNILQTDLLISQNQETRHDLQTKLNIINQQLKLFINLSEHQELQIIENDKNVNKTQIVQTLKHPLLLELAAKITEKKTKINHLEQEKWPDLSVRLAYRIRNTTLADNGDNFVSAGISIPMPSFSLSSKNHQVRQQQFEQRALLQEKRNIEQQIALQIIALKARLKRHQEKHEHYKNQILPQSKLILRSAMQNYITQSIGFEKLIESQRQVIKLEKEKIDIEKNIKDIHNQLDYWNSNNDD